MEHLHKDITKNIQPMTSLVSLAHLCIHSGELTSDYNGRMGNIAVVKYNGRTSSYSHLQVVFPPGWYERGEVIGLCGNTGSWSTGPHVHFESDKPYTFFGI